MKRNGGPQGGSFTLGYGDVVTAPPGGGTWRLSGNVVTTFGGGRSESSAWTYLTQNSATVSVPGIGTRTLYRCTGSGAGM